MYCLLTIFRTTWENVVPPKSAAGLWEQLDMAEAEVPNAFFTSAFLSKSDLQESQVRETKRTVWNKEGVHLE